jgi:fibronectin-binding autotransporter adhesin
MRNSHRLVFAGALAAALFAAPSARAITFFWDGGTTNLPDPGDGASTGGPGDWSTAIFNWDQGAGLPFVPWPAPGTDNDATFGGATAGTVTLQTDITVNDVLFNTTGYVIDRANANALTLVPNGATAASINTAAGISATIHAPIVGTAALSKAGLGTLTLSGTNTYTGITSIAGGTLIMAGPQALGTSTAATAITFTNGSTLEMATDGGDFTYRGQVGSGVAATIVSSVKTPGAGIDHALGIVNIGGSAAAGTTRLTIVQGSAVTGGTSSITLAGVTLGAGGTNVTTTFSPTTANLILGDITATVTTTGTKTLNLDGTSAGNSVTGAISNGVLGTVVALTKTSTGTWTLLGSNTYTAGTVITGGVLALGSDAALGSGAVNLNTPSGTIRSADANARTISNAITYSSDFTLGSPTTGNLLFTGAVNSGSLAKVFNVQNAVTEFSGIISGGGTNAKTKAGPGKLIFSGANTYTGSTVVRAGTLIVSGSLAATNVVSVGDSANLQVPAVLGGSGTIGNVTASGDGTAASGATIAPGNTASAAGILTTGSLSVLSGAHLAMQIGGTTAGGEVPTGYDRILAGGPVSLTGGDLNLTLQGTPTFSAGDKLYLIVNNSGAAVTDTFSTLNGNAFDPANIMLGSQQFTLSYTENFLGLGNLDSIANDVALVAVPEPGSIAALIGGVAMLAIGRRNQRRA